MSQIFDSLRRARKADARSASSRTARGDAVLATLGYVPPRRRQYLPILVSLGLLLGIVAVGWITWRAYLDANAAIVPSSRVISPGMPRPAAPPARPTLPASDSAPNPSADAKTRAAPPIARTVKTVDEVSSVGRRTSPEVAALHTARPSEPRPAVLNPDPTAPSVAAPAPPRENDLELALYYHRAGDFANAMQHYRALIQQNEMNAQAHNNLGLLYQERNLLQESARELQRAVVLEPRNPGTRNNFGVTLLMLGQVDHAAAEFQTALWLEPRNVDALINLSLVQRRTGQLDTAKETLLRVLNVAPRNAAAHYNLAQLYDDSNERARAVEHYRLFLDYAGAEYADRAAAVRARIAALNTMSK